MAGRLGLSVSETARRCLRSARPLVVSTEDADAVRECSRQISRVGNSLNQIAHRLNAGVLGLRDSEAESMVLVALNEARAEAAAVRSKLDELLAREGARVREALDDRA